MIVPITHRSWQTLRACLRHAQADKRPCPGFALRVTPTRFTKGGAHLPALVDAGLLQIVKEGPTPPESTYRITDLGIHAAEFGEFETPKMPPFSV